MTQRRGVYGNAKQDWIAVYSDPRVHCIPLPSHTDTIAPLNLCHWFSPAKLEYLKGKHFISTKETKGAFGVLGGPYETHLDLITFDCLEEELG